MRALAALLFVALAASPACKRDSEVTVVTLPTASASQPPIDHLAPGELLEGDAKAFGLVLPRGVRVDHAFADVVYASGTVSPDALSNYVRARVRDGKVTAGAASTVFERVRVPAVPDHELDIRVRPAEGTLGAKIEVRDVTPTKSPPMPDEAARWNAAGVKPNGEILDPTHLH